MRDRSAPVPAEFYEHEDIAQILHRSARILDVPSDPEGIQELAKRSRCTPRVATVCCAGFDYAQVRSDGKLTPFNTASLCSCSKLMNRAGPDGPRILRTIAEKFGGGPVGLRTIAVALERMKEPWKRYELFLIQEGFLELYTKDESPSEPASISRFHLTG